MNRKLATAKAGRTAVVRDSWRNEKMKIAGVSRVSMKSSVFSFLLRSIYGEQKTATDLMEEWRKQSIIDGYGRHGFSEDECLVIELKEIEEKNKDGKQDNPDSTQR